MPICHKCNKEFTNKVTIDGVPRILKSRKYCLECSPWKKHNTCVLEKKNDNIFKVCSNCQRGYKKVIKGSLCSSCNTNKRKDAIKKKAVEYKGGKCEICGYDRCLKALVFHHHDPFNKDFNISGNHCKAWNTIKQELDKCMMVCQNCHAELHCEISLNLKLKVFNNFKTYGCDTHSCHTELQKTWVDMYLGPVAPSVAKNIICPQCNKEFETPERPSNKIRFCSNECASLNHRKISNRPTKEELEQMIQVLPWTKIGEKYGVTGNAAKNGRYNIKLKYHQGVDIGPKFHHHYFISPYSN